jgi:DNA-binding LacI/PurR family transcriptional regulator
MQTEPGASDAPAVPANRALSQLRSWIADRQLLPGSRLPSERELARRLGVTRFVVRAVLGQLEGDGAIRSLSERIRVVADESARAPSVMAETVALFTHLSSRPLPGEGPRHMMQALYHGVSEALQAHGLNILVVPPERSAMARIHRLIAQRPLAWIVLEDALVSEVGQGVLNAVCARGIPTAVYGDVLDAATLADPRFDVASSDQHGGSYALTRWLIERGLKRVARFSDNPDPLRAAQVWRARREQGYRDACRDGGIGAMATIEGARLEGGDGSRQAFERQVRATAGFLVEHLAGASAVDALMVVSDGLLFDVAGACRLLGADPGRRPVLAGYDNYWMGAPERRFDPVTPLATVDKDLHEVGAALVRLATDRAAGRSPSARRVLTVAQRLVVEA